MRLSSPICLKLALAGRQQGGAWLTDTVHACGCQVEAGRPHGVGSLNLGPAQAGVQYSGEWCHGQRHGKVAALRAPSDSERAQLPPG